MNRIISLFLFIFIASCLNAQYNTPIRNKVTLGKQTTADGLVWRGVENDTALITPFSDTSAYIILDTVTNLLWHYKIGSNAWTQAGGSTFDTTTLNLVSRFGLKLNISDTSSMLTNYYRSGRALGTPLSGTLTNATGLPISTGLTELGAANRIPYALSTTALTTSSGLTFDGTNFATTGTATATRFNPTANTETGTGMFLPATNTLGFSTNGTNKLTIDASGNLIVGGTSATNKFQVDITNNTTYSSSNTLAGGVITYLRNTSTTNSTDATIRLEATGSGNLAAASISAVHTGSGSSALTFGTRNAGSDVTERMRLDASGNLGLGVTPSAWQSNFTPIQGLGYSLYSASATQVRLSANEYFNAGSIYRNNGVATLYQQSSGEHQFFTAPSGIAGNPITFTQAMTLNASGNLSIGNTNNTYKLDVSGTGIYRDNLTLLRAGSNDQLLIKTSSTNGTRIGHDALGLYISNDDTTLDILRLYGGTSGSLKLTIASNGAATFSSTVSATQYTATSTGGSGLRIYGAAGTNQWDMYLNSTNLRFSDNTGIGNLISDRPVGIGTTPTAKLEIFQAVYTGASNYANKNIKINSGFGSGYTAGTIVSLLSGYDGSNIYTTDIGHLYDGTGYALTFSTNDNTTGDVIERMRITSAGNVGIGTQSPTPGFQLQLTSANARFAMLNNSASNTSNYSQMAFGHGTANGQYAEFYRENNNQIFHIFNGSGGSIGLSTRFVNNVVTYDIYLNSSGNVGIGTTGPTEKLHVVGNGLFTGNVTAASFIPTSSTIPTNGMYLPATNSLGFSTAGTQRIHINSAGKVGIGTQMTTANNDGIFNVAGDMTFENNFFCLRANGSIDDYVQFKLRESGVSGNFGTGETGQAEFITYSANNSIGALAIGNFQPRPVIFGTSNLERVRVKGDGEMNIGYGATDMGAYILQINGTPQATGALYVTSDEKFKENITPLNKGLEIVSKLKPVTFNFINDTENNFSVNQEVGFIAQDVDRALSTETFAKSIVNSADDSEPTSTMSLATQNLIPILVKAIQEQQSLIKALEQRILILENK